MFCGLLGNTLSSCCSSILLVEYDSIQNMLPTYLSKKDMNSVILEIKRDSDKPHHVETSLRSPFHPTLTTDILGKKRVIRELQVPPRLCDAGWHFRSCLGAENLFFSCLLFSLSITHLIALHIHTYYTESVSLARNYFLSPVNSVFISLSLPLIFSIFLSPSFPHSLSVSISLVTMSCSYEARSEK